MDIEKRLKGILSRLSGEETIKNEATLREELALDSLSMVTLLIEIEEEFGIELDESDMNPFDLVTVQNIVDMVKKYQSGDEDE